jgi:phosphoglucosamine mutase
MNINAEGGATKPETIQRFTVESGADVGVSFDGDADRCVFSDAQGRLINGDRTIGLWAHHHKVVPSVVVGTVMSNGGFEAYLKASGIRLERTPVGDKYVAQKIAETGARIGGEQSGHIIFPERQPTGDGLVTMLEVLRVIKQSGESTSSFVEAYDPWPQLLINIEVGDRSTWNQSDEVQSAILKAERAVSDHGRVNVRASGTQPMVRVMVEADSYELRDQVASDLLAALETHAGGKVYSKVDLTHALGD